MVYSKIPPMKSFLLLYLRRGDNTPPLYPSEGFEEDSQLKNPLESQSPLPMIEHDFEKRREGDPGLIVPPSLDLEGRTGRRGFSKRMPFRDWSLSLSPFVIDSRFGIQFCFKLFQFIFDNVSGDFAVWVIEVPEHPNPCHTGCHTGRLFALLNKFDTEPTFFNITFLLNNSDIIGTSGNAILAANALIFIHQNHSILSLM
jgi:hypothetical protein